MCFGQRVTCSFLLSHSLFLTVKNTQIYVFSTIWVLVLFCIRYIFLPLQSTIIIASLLAQVSCFVFHFIYFISLLSTEGPATESWETKQAHIQKYGIIIWNLPISFSLFLPLQSFLLACFTVFAVAAGVASSPLCYQFPLIAEVQRATAHMQMMCLCYCYRCW